MNFAMILYIMGYICTIEAGLMLLPLGVGLIYGENGIWGTFGISIVVLLAVGLPLVLRKPKNQSFYAKEGFVSVALGWIVMSLFGALPMYLSGEIGSFIECFFEAVSGFTTTGASIIPDLAKISRSLLMWRSFTHWIGGMGILVFLLMVLPMAGKGSMHLMRAESPGPIVGKILPKLSSTAKILYAIYSGMTVVLTILLLLGGLDLYDSLIHAFGTAGTGGFSNYAQSVGHFNSPYIEWVITVFMILFGINFNVFYLLLLGHVGSALKSEEMRVFFIIIIGSVALITANIIGTYGEFSLSVRAAAFQVASIITTTGFATNDFAAWPDLSRCVLMLLMIVGACAGSTGGGIKISRLVISAKFAWQEIMHINHPRTVTRVRFEGQPVGEETIRSTCSYLILYAFITVISILLISIENFDTETTVSSVLACMGNIGPGMGAVGPMGGFYSFSNMSKLLLSVDMLFGRLEIFPMLMLFSPSLWFKSK